MADDHYDDEDDDIVRAGDILAARKAGRKGRPLTRDELRETSAEPAHGRRRRSDPEPPRPDPVYDLPPPPRQDDVHPPDPGPGYDPPPYAGPEPAYDPPPYADPEPAYDPPPYADPEPAYDPPPYADPLPDPPRRRPDPPPPPPRGRRPQPQRGRRPDRPPSRADHPPAAFRTLCSLMARTQVTRVRVLSLLALDLLAIASGVVYGSGVRTGAVPQPLEAGAQWIDTFGLGFVVPVATMLFASSMLRDPIDDKTLVYLWLRPVPRGTITLAAAATSFVVTWPLVVPAMATAAACTGGGQALVIGTVAACTVSVAAYTGVFVALGARVKLPLVWGLLYVMIWETYGATTSTISKSLALRSYGSSVLRHFAYISPTRPALPLAWLPLLPAIVVPLVIGGAALFYATRHLSKRDVD